MGLPAIFDLTGRTAIVTGAGGGLGREFALVLAEAGACVACTDLDEAAAKRTLDALCGGSGLAVKVDVADEQQVEAMVARCLQELGSVDVLVNNAGIGEPRSVPLHRVRTDDWRRVLAVDLDGAFYCSRAVLGHMAERGSGKVVNIASMYGLQGSALSAISAYSAAKGAIVNLSREMALQYAPYGVQVNALCPGFVRTGLAGGVYDDPEFLTRLVATVPAGRIAEPAELRGALLLLCSAASDYITGQTLVVDGGVSAS
ncbi:MAG: 3-oxoacyl-ACP reductase FabG [Acidimicrobiales bacterium]